MAIAKGNETKEVSFKRYTGIGNVNVLAINPTKAELAKLGREVEEEPVYVTEKDGVKSIRLSLYVKPIEIDEMTFFKQLKRLKEESRNESTDIRYLIKEIVPTYQLKEEVQQNREKQTPDEDDVV